MNVTQAIKERRSVKSYQRRPIPPEVLKLVVEAGYLAPSGGNKPSREFLVVTDPGQLGRLSEVHEFCGWLAGAPAAIVVLGRHTVSRYWVEDASIAAGQIWLSAVDAGLGVAWGAMYQSDNEQESARREQACREILDLPDDRRVITVLGLGYPAAAPKEKKMADYEKIVHWGAYAGAKS